MWTDFLPQRLCQGYHLASLTELSSWLEGSYAIPQSIHGCPRTENVGWLSTTAEVITKGAGMTNKMSALTYQQGPFDATTLVFRACASVEGVGSNDMSRDRPPWPAGSYCIYKLQPQCPPGRPMKYGQYIMKIWDFIGGGP